MAARQKDPVHAGRIRRAQQRSEILRILNAVEEEQQWILSALSCRRNDLLDGDVSDGCDIGEYALMAYPLGHSRIQLSPTDHIHCDTVLTCKIAQLVHGRATQPIREQNTIDAAPCLDRLYNGMATREDMGGLFLTALLCVFLRAFVCAFLRALFLCFHCAPPCIIRAG